MLIDGAHHSRELITIKMTFSILLKLLHGVYHEDNQTFQILKTTQVYIIPVVNPDGVAFIEENETGDGTILLKRKNGRRNSQRCKFGEVDEGVDLNRNYDINWSGSDPFDRFNSESECSQSYPGLEAWSEPETRTMRDFILSHKDTLKFVLNYHSYGNMFIVPYSANDSSL